MTLVDIRYRVNFHVFATPLASLVVGREIFIFQMHQLPRALCSCGVNTLDARRRGKKESAAFFLPAIRTKAHTVVREGDGERSLLRDPDRDTSRKGEGARKSANMKRWDEQDKKKATKKNTNYNIGFCGRTSRRAKIGVARFGSSIS